MRREVLWLHVDAKKDGPYLPPPHSGYVRLVIGMFFGQSIPFIDDVPGSIHMRIDDEDILHQAFVSLRRRLRRNGADAEKLDRKRDAHHDAAPE